MRRNDGVCNSALFGIAVVLCVVLGVPSASAQQQINPRLPPPPPVEIGPPPPIPAAALDPLPITPPKAIPEHVTLAGGVIIDVVLDTPLSTRIAKEGQTVTFRTTSALRLQDDFEIPPETAISGKVTSVRKPGGFGKSGELLVKIERIELPASAPTPIVARLQSADMDARGRIKSDNTRGTDLMELAQYTLSGTLLGARIHGGKGAAVGAGAGAFAALIILMSHRGRDVYLEPGMPFVVVLDEPLQLPGQDVYAAQTSYAHTHPPAREIAEDASAAPRNSTDSAIPPNERPKLKRRPLTP